MTPVSCSSNPIGVALTAGPSGDHTNAVEPVLDGMLRERSGGGPGAVLHAEIDIGIDTKQTRRQR